MKKTTPLWAGGLGIALVIVSLIAASVVKNSQPIVPQAQRLDNPFGFLGSRHFSVDDIAKTNAGWVREHPGAFVYGHVLEEPGDEFQWNEADEQILWAGDTHLSSLVTLWPYAEWDQQGRAECQINGDVFTDVFGNFRCNPTDWATYTNWVTAVVERYDGDGVDDVPKLSLPVKYWEVMNEPDLSYQRDDSFGEPNPLTFYVGGPADYAELLRQTAVAIRAADPEAKVVLAGAAGGDDRFLQFYDELFAEPDIATLFDVANVHCISNDDYASFNVAPYAELLTRHNLEQPIWVTEAEAFVSPDADINATQVQASTRQAFALGAERIFYTSPTFTPYPDKRFFGEAPTFTPTVSGEAPITAYRTIFQEFLPVNASQL